MEVGFGTRELSLILLSLSRLQQSSCAASGKQSNAHRPLLITATPWLWRRTHRGPSPSFACTFERIHLAPAVPYSNHQWHAGECVCRCPETNMLFTIANQPQSHLTLPCTSNFQEPTPPFCDCPAAAAATGRAGTAPAAFISRRPSSKILPPWTVGAPR